MAFKDNLRRIRVVERGMSQSALEVATSIKREYISKLESGDLKNPTLSTLEKLAKGLGVPLDYLVRRRESSVEEIQNRFIQERLNALVREVKICRRQLSQQSIKMSVLNDNLNLIISEAEIVSQEKE